MGGELERKLLTFYRPLITILLGVDLGGQHGHVPSIIENRPCI